MRSIKQLMDLTGRTALVTGGAGHIGAAACETLAEMGANVIVMDFQQAPCANLVQHIASTYGVKAFPMVIDLSDETHLRHVPDLIEQQTNRLDILINCAALVGISPLKGWAVPFAEQSSETWRLAFEVNLTAPFILAQVCASLLKQSGHGSIINVSSIYGTVGPDMRLYDDTALGNPAAYAASKGGLQQLTRWLATNLAPDVRVNTLIPGGVWRNQPDVFRQRYESRTPLQRMATEEDFKGAVAYLASDLSAYMTGQEIIVDGGWTAW